MQKNLQKWRAGRSKFLQSYEFVEGLSKICGGLQSIGKDAALQLQMDVIIVSCRKAPLEPQLWVGDIKALYQFRLDKQFGYSAILRQLVYQCGSASGIHRAIGP